MSDVTIIKGPVAPLSVGGIIYSVTLGNGYVVTSPEGFGNHEEQSPRLEPVWIPRRPIEPQEPSADETLPGS